LENLNERGHLIYIGGNIKVDLEKVGYGLHSSGSGQSLVVGFCEFGNEFFLISWVTVKFSGSTLFHGVSSYTIRVTGNRKAESA
jgi:hypothetical protein